MEFKDIIFNKAYWMILSIPEIINGLPAIKNIYSNDSNNISNVQDDINIEILDEKYLKEMLDYCVNIVKSQDFYRSIPDKIWRYHLDIDFIQTVFKKHNIQLNIDTYSSKNYRNILRKKKISSIM